MKLRHLLLASFAACAFASCSDDSSNGIEIPEENYQMIDANVSLTATVGMVKYPMMPIMRKVM